MAAWGDRPLPVISIDSEPYWRSSRDHALRLQRCVACQRYRFYPTPMCPSCAARGFSWELISGKGTLYSYTVVHRAAGPVFEAHVPLVVGLVTLDEGPTMMSNIVGSRPEEVSIGLRVGIAYEDVNDEVTFPMFRVLAGDQS